MASFDKNKLYLAIVEMTESSDLFAFVEDITVYFHISHDAEFFEMSE